jgi:hypothetical protein
MLVLIGMGRESRQGTLPLLIPKEDRCGHQADRGVREEEPLWGGGRGRLAVLRWRWPRWSVPVVLRVRRRTGGACSSCNG